MYFANSSYLKLHNDIKYADYDYDYYECIQSKISGLAFDGGGLENFFLLFIFYHLQNCIAFRCPLAMPLCWLADWIALKNVWVLDFGGSSFSRLFLSSAFFLRWEDGDGDGDFMVLKTKTNLVNNSDIIITTLRASNHISLILFEMS